MGELDGVGLAAIGAGSLIAYAGVKGYSVPHALAALITGKPPSTGGQANPITTPTGTTGTLGAGGGVGGIAADFETYAGKVPYVWGGASPRGWDCSGSCNYVCCHDMGLGIPGFAGGTFDGSQHGPSTFGWLAWAPGKLTRVPAGQQQTDDVVLWQTHMGICVDNTTYISAYDTQDGTVAKPIHGGGPWGEIATFWRYPSSPAATAGSGPGTNPKTHTL